MGEILVIYNNSRKLSSIALESPLDTVHDTNGVFDSLFTYFLFCADWPGWCQSCGSWMVLLLKSGRALTFTLLATNNETTIRQLVYEAERAIVQRTSHSCYEIGMMADKSSNSSSTDTSIQKEPDSLSEIL